MKKLLLIAFKFPPYAGVGGFRWSKLSKYLAQMGHEIHVVTVNWKYMGPNTFIEDVKHSNIKIHRIKSGYPHQFKYKSFNNKIINKLKIIIWYFLNRVILSWFFYDDEAQRWGKYLIPYCEKLLNKENINVVISTGHPFQSNRWAAILKERNNKIKLIQDFQDPWFENPFIKRTQKNSRRIKNYQVFTIEKADTIVAVTQSLLDIYLMHYKKKNGVVIENGVDFIKVQKYKNIKSNKFSFIYIGNIGNGRDKPFLEFLKAVDNVREKIPEINIKIVGGNLPRSIKSRFPNLIKMKILEYNPPVSQKEVYEMVVNSKYALQLNAKEFPYLVSTKVYEYAYLKVPTISLNYGGEIEKLIKKNDLGYSINVEKQNIEKFLLNLFKKEKETFQFETNTFSYKYLAKKYSNLINKL